MKCPCLRNGIAIAVSAILVGSSGYLLWQQLVPQRTPVQGWVMKKRIPATELPVAELPWMRDVLREPLAATIQPAAVPFVERGPVVAWLRPAVLPTLRPKNDVDEPTRTVVRVADVPWVRSEVRPIRLQPAVVPKLAVRRTVDAPEPAALTPAAVPSFPAKPETKPDGDAVSLPVE